MPYCEYHEISYELGHLCPRCAPRPPWFARFCLTVGQFVSVLSCIGSAASPFLCQHYLTNRIAPNWATIVLILIACIGFCYNAAMFVVFTRVKQLGS